MNCLTLADRMGTIPEASKLCRDNRFVQRESIGLQRPDDAVLETGVYLMTARKCLGACGRTNGLAECVLELYTGRGEAVKIGRANDAFVLRVVIPNVIVPEILNDATADQVHTADGCLSKLAVRLR